MLAALLAAQQVHRALPDEPPPFSWETVPLFMHSQNQSGPFNETALKFMAQYPLITIGGGHDRGVHKCCNEEKVVVAARGIKGYNSSGRILYYQNTLINFPQTHLATISHDLLLHDKSGNLVSFGQFYTLCTRYRF